MRSFTVLLGLAGLAAGVAVGGAGPAAAAPACTGTVQIPSLAFKPPVVAPGQIATATLTAQNCTDQPLTGSATWVGRFVGASVPPPGCPVIDPIARPTDFAAGGTLTQSTGYLVFSGCTATDLQVTVRITGSDGVLLAQQTADVPIRAAQPTCSVTYDRQSEWQGGFVGTVTVTNLAAAIDGWTVTFAFPGDQHVNSAWNAVVSQAGAAVTAANAGYNAQVPTDGRVSFGFVGSWQTSDATPTTFALNGNTCTTS